MNSLEKMEIRFFEFNRYLDMPETTLFGLWKKRIINNKES